MTHLADQALPASFRDPAGFLFERDGVLFRQVNRSYAEIYDACVTNGLFDRLIGAGLLVAHREVDEPGLGPEAHRVIRPEVIDYISYPYEWSFSQLKDAALLTLEVQRQALELGFSLKDASAYNIQFGNDGPIFIDTLSFEKYREGAPWVAYRQFCQHFLAPLTLMSKRDLRYRQLLSRYIDGLPLDLVSQTLPLGSYFRYSTLAHIHLHAKSQRRYQDAGTGTGRPAAAKISRPMFEALISSLRRAIEKTGVKNISTEWGDYYSDTNYSDESMHNKEGIIEELSKKYFESSDTVHDLGANTGRFSRIVSSHVNRVISHDVDEMAVEKHYRSVKAQQQTKVLPLILDLTNPTPSIGWNLEERLSFQERANGDVALALALIHHICISNNVPLTRFASFLASTFRMLIIEFVPKEDSQVKRLLATREDIFGDYSIEGFEHAFGKYFDVLERRPVGSSCRTIYVMQKA